MHFQYLVEDQSGAALIRILMQKIVELYPNATYDCKGFRGIGGFTRKNTIKETKTGKLLNDLATYLRGFDRSLQSFPSVIIVVLDSDDHDVQQFRSELEAVAMQNTIKIDHVFCLAVEEIEAWLLGDRHALLSAYPHAKMHVLNTYVQDSICGTWEVLADAVYPGGTSKLSREHASLPQCQVMNSKKTSTIQRKTSFMVSAYFVFDSFSCDTFNLGCKKAGDLFGSPT